MSERELPVFRLARWAEAGFPAPRWAERASNAAMLIFVGAFIVGTIATLAGAFG